MPKIKKLSTVLLTVFILIMAIAPIFDKKNTAYADAPPVAHLFTHALIGNEKVAFNSKNPYNKYLEQDCITVSEFKEILQRLYLNNYVLVNIEDTYYTQKGKIFKKSIFLPKGKKPLLLSFDDINYYSKNADKGMNNKLCVIGDKLATVCNTAEEKISYDNEVITIVENFIDSHKDFSINNAKGIICLTGFDGILGYRTQRDSPYRNSEIREAQAVVNFLKQKNWKFACHTYGHYHMKRQSDSHFIADITKWQNEVEPILGKTNIFCYPYGEWVTYEGDKISNKHQFLLNNGYNYFLSVGSDNYFTENHNNSYLFMDRIPLDGTTLIKYPKALKRFIDLDELVDTNRLNIWINK